MTTMQIPGCEVRVDPDDITKLEISGKNNPHSYLKIFLRGGQEPTVVNFASRKEAIEFYEAIWQQRQSNDEQIVEVGDFT